MPPRNPTIEPSSDARATVDVLHGLLERVGNLGLLTVDDLKEFEHRVSPQRRAKRTWATDLPEAPGIYIFYARRPGQQRQVLYVGKATNIRRRVRTYFTSSETRPRMDEMVRVATWRRLWSAPPNSRPRCESCARSRPTSPATTGAPAARTRWHG